MPRCTLDDGAVVFEGTPPAQKVPSAAGPWGDALVAVRRARGDKPFRVDPLPDAGPLVGMSRHDISTTLGTPRPCKGKGLPSAPCESEGQGFYSLYRLPTGWVGGGPELLLTFDAKNVCTRAEIRHTQ